MSCKTCRFWVPQKSDRIWQVPKDLDWGQCEGVGSDHPDGGGLFYIRSDFASAGPDLITHYSFTCAGYLPNETTTTTTTT